MKLAIMSESPVDTAVITILAKAILLRPIELVEPRFDANGWARVFAALDGQLSYLHYNTDASGVIIIVDSDDTPVHDPSHLSEPDAQCRYCRILKKVKPILASFRPRSDGSKVEVAIAIPVPAVEAWLRGGKDPHAAEAPYIRDYRAGQRRSEKRKQLKRDVYDTDQPSISQATQVAAREAERLATDLGRLRKQFPVGFGSFYEMLAAW